MPQKIYQYSNGISSVFLRHRMGINLAGDNPIQQTLPLLNDPRVRIWIAHLAKLVQTLGNRR